MEILATGIADIGNMITNFGFPIVAVVALAWYAKDTNDKYRQDIKDADAQHKVEMEKITTALNNNTLALTKLCERMESEGK